MHYEAFSVFLVHFNICSIGSFANIEMVIKLLLSSCQQYNGTYCYNNPLTKIVNFTYCLHTYNVLIYP